MTIERTLAAAGDGPILIALSGGGDSVALLHLMAEQAGASRLFAIVVDHALREGSADDAARAASFAVSLGVAAEIQTLSWDEAPAPPPAALGPRSLRQAQGSAIETVALSQKGACLRLSKAGACADAGEGAGAPKKRSQQAARRARYAVLCDAARVHNARVIAVAHSADDQAETVFMRAASGSGWRGLAGMAEIAPAPVWPEGRGVLLARPLLDMRRADLRAYLRARGADWIEDPANANTAFERVRIRARLAEMERDGFDPMRLKRFATKLRMLADEVDAEALALVRRAARFDGPEIVITLSDWRAPEETRRRALSVLIAAAAGAERTPEAPALARLEARIATPSFRGASLGGARVRRLGDALRISRDPGAILGRDVVAAQQPLNLYASREMIWDGRLALTAAKPLQLMPAPDAPRVADGESVMRLAEATECGLVTARWLTEQHLLHQLGPLSTTKPGF